MEQQGYGKGQKVNKQISSGMDDIGSLIRTVRGQKVILDNDLARIFGVPTFRSTRQSNVIAIVLQMIFSFN